MMYIMNACKAKFIYAMKGHPPPLLSGFLNNRPSINNYAFCGISKIVFIK